MRKSRAGPKRPSDVATPDWSSADPFLPPLVHRLAEFRQDQSRPGPEPPRQPPSPLEPPRSAVSAGQKRPKEPPGRRDGTVTLFFPKNDGRMCTIYRGCPRASLDTGGIRDISRGHGRIIAILGTANEEPRGVQGRGARPRPRPLLYGFPLKFIIAAARRRRPSLSLSLPSTLSRAHVSQVAISRLTRIAHRAREPRGSSAHRYMYIYIYMYLYIYRHRTGGKNGAAGVLPRGNP